VTGPVYTATATDPGCRHDPDLFAPGDDAALLQIDATTGAVEFKPRREFSIHRMPAATILRRQGHRPPRRNTTSQDVAISVTNANEGPTLTSGATGERQRECDRPGLQPPTANRPGCRTTLTYSLSGDDAALFKIDASNRRVEFKTSPDFGILRTPRQQCLRRQGHRLLRCEQHLAGCRHQPSPMPTRRPTITTVAASPTQAAAAQSEIVLHVSGDQYQGSPLMRL